MNASHNQGLPELSPSITERRSKEMESGDPLVIIRALAEARGWPEAAFEEIKALYLGRLEKPEDLCPNEDIAMTLDKTFLPMDRFLTGEIFAKKEAYEKAAKMISNPVFKAKWLRQVELLSRVAPRVGSNDISFSLRMKWIPSKYIAEFLRGEGYGVSLRERVFTIWGQAYNCINLFAGHLQNYLNGHSWKSRQAGARDRLEELDENFNQWMHQHSDILELTEHYNRCFNSHIESTPPASSLKLGGILSGQVILHPYQNSEVRRLLEAGRGICGFEVGLGKTYIALALAAMGIKTGRFKRFCFAVPSSVLGNWRREAGLLFNNRYVEKYFFFVRGGANAGRDLRRAAASGRPFVIMSKESFGRLPTTPTTREKFVNHAKVFCPAMELTFRKEIIEAPQAADRPLFESFGFDALILDEIHVFKNTFEASSSNKSIVHLSTPPFSKTALNAAVKAFWVRAANRGTGVYGLTATPVTNSPFEIFNILSWVCDLREFAVMGVETIDDIIEVFGRVKTIGHVRISGQVKEKRGLLGFINLDGLRNIFHRSVKLMSVEETDGLFACPQKTEHEELVQLTAPQAALYEELRQRALKLEKAARKDFEAREAIFSIIRDMDRLTMDVDLYERMTTYLFQPEKAAEVKHLMALLPDRWPHLEYSKSEAAWKAVEKKLKPKIYRSPEGFLALRLPESLERRVADCFRQVGLDESDLTHPLNPKYARLLELSKYYLEGGGNQLVFTEEKGEHAKLRRLLAWNLNVPISRIGVINADEAAGGRLERLLQDYGRGDLRLVVANRKAELGLNLQTGTVAIHHLSLPWTPASLYQRNGRGLRQGNQEKTVHIHYYVSEKTFDSYRRTILEAKAGWINELLNGQMPTMGHNQGVSLEEQLDLLASSPKAAEARRKKRRLIAEMERQKKKKDGLFNSLRQLIWLSTQSGRKDQRLLAEIGKIELKCRKLAALLSDMETGARSPANAYRDYLNYINTELKELHKQRNATKRKPQYLPESLKHLEALTDKDTKDDSLTDADDQERLWEESYERITALQTLKTPQEMAHWQDKARELYTEDLAGNKAVIARLEERRLNLQKLNQAGLEQTRHYLMRVHEKEGLPFSLELIDQLDSFLVTPKNNILNFGQFYLQEGRGYIIISGQPKTNNALVDVFDPMAGKTRQTLKLETLEDCRAANPDDFLLDRPWRYGRIHKLGLFEREIWDRHVQWLQFDLSFGAVYCLENRFIPIWNPHWPIPEGAVPAWPEPEDAEFRRQVCREYLEAQDQGNQELMSDLFGEGFESMVQNIAEGREAGLPLEAGELWEKMRQTLTPGQANDEELIKKIQELLKLNLPSQS